MLNNSFIDAGIEIVSKFEDGSVTVRLNKMGNQIVTLTADEAVVVLDLDHEQYNADHRNTRHKVSLDAYDPDNKTIPAGGNPLQQLIAEVQTPETIYLDKFDEQEQQSKQKADYQKLMAIYPKLTDPQKLVYDALTTNKERLKDKELAIQLNMSAQNFSNHKWSLFKKIKKLWSKLV
ncbi:hypothetical protein [Limosilactobacillus fermentum]